MTDTAFTTCLWFDTQAEEAVGFYVSVFKNSSVGRVLRQGEADTVLTVEFELNGQKFVALNGGPMFTFNEAVSFQIPCADQDEVDHYWSRLIDGGQASACGWLKDRFGVSWQVVPTQLIDMHHDPDPEKARRVMETMLTMVKLDIAPLVAAYEGTS
ncbi:VOC family protein [Pseudonocardia spinosispora]|uniref:VOC family protein n=1 Tax=Pseudonocardia spinosispora TaxID=103441 RepID=UPI0003FBBFDB|nr:VOC family protein [Pseudonocardia spinosispora]